VGALVEENDDGTGCRDIKAVCAYGIKLVKEVAMTDG